MPNPFHRRHRVRRRGGGTQPRGFTIVELAAALTFFAIFAGGVTLAVGSAVGTTQRARVDRALVAELDSLVAEATTAPWPELLEGPTTVPSPCTGTPGGWLGSSCVVVLGRDVTVTWTTTSGSAGSGDDTRDYLDVTASGEAAGLTRDATRRVWAPTGRWYGEDSLVRIQATAATGLSGRPVWVLAADETFAGVGFFDSRGTALVTVDPTDCTVVAPCAASLEADRWGGVADGLTLTGGGSLGGVVAVPAAVTFTSVGWSPTTTLDATLVARGDAGAETVAPSTVAGTICVWVDVDDHAGQRTATGCNTATAERIVIDRAPHPTLPGITLPLVPGTATVAADPGTGSLCTGLGTSGWDPTGTPAGWAPADVCPTWTWGVPSSVLIATTESTESDGRFTVTLTAGIVDAALVWSGAAGRPAAGFDGEGRWEHPRDLPACAATSTCTPPVTVPEDDVVGCVGHCLSTAPASPRLTTGPGAAEAVDLDPSGTTEFPLTVTGASVTVTVTVPTAGTLDRWDGAAWVPITTTTTLATAATDPTVDLRYTEPGGGTDLAWFTATVDDAGVARSVDVALHRNSPAWWIHGGVLRAAQGDGATPFAVRVLDPTGAAVASAAITSTGSTGITVDPATISAGAGTATANVGAAPAGRGTLPLTAANGRAGTAVTAIAATATTITTPDPFTVAAGGSAQVTVVVTDAAGAAAADIVVAATVTGIASGVTFTPTACVSAADGACTVTLDVAAGTAPGVYTLQWASGAATATTTVTVTA